MTGGKSTPKKDKAIKVSSGQLVSAGTILSRGISTYKAGKNDKGLATLHPICDVQVYFSKTKTSHGRVRTFINVLAVKQEKKEK